MTVTILTPTYNRAYLLPELFASLQRQSCKDFQWLIVDDGSTDHTQALVNDFMENADFPIRYFYQQNGGRHTAINRGVTKTDTELIFPVDSDDQLLPDAIKIIIDCHRKYNTAPGIGLYAFQRCDKKGVIEVPLPWNEAISNYSQCRIKENRPGNMAEVFLSSVLREYPFPEFSDERFLSEDITWINIAQKYNCVFINQAIYQCEYREDGLTRNDKRLKFSSPKGATLRGKALMNLQCGIKANLKGAVIFNCYRKEIQGAVPDEINALSVREKVLLFLTKPLGLIYRTKWKHSIR